MLSHQHSNKYVLSIISLAPGWQSALFCVPFGLTLHRQHHGCLHGKTAFERTLLASWLPVGNRGERRTAVDVCKVPFAYLT